ncbi:hypothetical protein KJ359_005434 [Pestalotiopsis sp. 9143b]|nr:hypothetical protein KJ359_005434 [Pestalotiopsis sp. 9143b]
MSAPQPLPIMPAAEQIVPAIKRILSRIKAVQDNIVETITPEAATFDTVVRPLAEVEDATCGEFRVILMLQYGAQDLATQDAVYQARKLYIEAEAEWTARDDLYKLFRAVKDRNEDIDDESRLLVSETLLDFERSGRGRLDKAEIAELSQLVTEIDVLQNKFQRNCAQENGGVWFSHMELDGVPNDDISKWKNSQPSQPPVASESAGKEIFVPFANGGTKAILTYAHSADTRKAMFLGDDKKLTENVTILDEIARKRYARAKTLGYANHSALRAERQLAKTPGWIEDFLLTVKDGLVPLGKNEIKELQHRRLMAIQERKSRKADHEPTTEIEAPQSDLFAPWDLFYYQNIIDRESHVDHATISEYFPVEPTARAMLGVFASLLGIRFDPVQDVDAANIWHDSVQVFSVWDGPGTDADFIGYLYFDLLWRKNKFRGNHNVTMEQGYRKPDGSRSYPSTILMCGFTTSSPDMPALLTHFQMTVMFHELGHAIHNLVSKTRYSRFHGTSGLFFDFGEMPSMMLENWCWIPYVVRELSCHYSTLSPAYLEKWRRDHPNEAEAPRKEIPQHLVDVLVKRRYAQKGMYYLRMLSICLFDFKIHNLSGDQALSDLDIRKIWYDTREELEGMDFSLCKEQGADMVSFNHLTAGLDSGYYAYLTCSAFAQDVFQTAFARDPRDRDRWDRYRHEVLEHGGSNPDALGALGRFLGHRPNSGALIEAIKQAISD